MKSMSIDTERKERKNMRRLFWLVPILWIATTLTAQFVFGQEGLATPNMLNILLVATFMTLGVVLGYWMRVITEIQVRRSGQQPDVAELEGYLQGKKL